MAMAIARRVVVLPDTASQPLFLSGLKAVLVWRTWTFDVASQSILRTWIGCVHNWPRFAPGLFFVD